MKKAKYILFYSTNYQLYRTVKVNIENIQMNDSRILYVFDLSMEYVARRIEKNLNFAKTEEFALINA